MRKNIFNKMIKGTVCAALALAVTVTGIPFAAGTAEITNVSREAEAATVTNKLPLIAYTRYTSSNLTTYSDVNLKNPTGYICYYDQCTILKIYSNGAVRVKYPVKRGTREAYAPMSGFFINSNFSTKTIKMGVRKTAYRKSSGNATIGTVFASDQVTIIGWENNRTAVIYPTSSGFYKCGWVQGIYRAAGNTENPQPSDSSVDNGNVQKNIYNLAMASVGTNGRTYQNWCGLSISTPYCAAYATYIANQAMIRAGYSSVKALQIVPKQASTALWADWFRNRNRYYSYASWYNQSRGVRISKNTSISAYTPKVGDIAAIDNDRNISTGLDHTGIVISVNGNRLTMAEGNTGAGTNATRTVKTYTYYKGGTYWYLAGSSSIVVVGFGNPAY